MNIQVERYIFTPISTVSRVYLDGVREFYCLEDTSRGLNSQDPLTEILAKKVPAQTAIPTGLYEVIIDDSARFERPMPHILNVPGFDGIRIHAGNTAKDTEGCLLLGMSFGIDFVGESRKAFESFFARLTAALKEGKCHINIVESKTAK